MIGTIDTPVRAVINTRRCDVEDAALAARAGRDARRHGGTVLRRSARGLARGGDAFLSGATSLVDRPFDRVLAVMPTMYDDLWTGAKGAYKTEPVVADGGEVIIYAPHISEVSYVHGELIDGSAITAAITSSAQWDRFRDYPWGILAHSTHVKGLGTYDAAAATETPRIRVTLATAIPRERCERINLGYLDPATIDPKTWDDGSANELVVHRAGEMLYRMAAGAGR